MNNAVFAHPGRARRPKLNQRAAILDRGSVADLADRVDGERKLCPGIRLEEIDVLALDRLPPREALARFVDILAILGPQRGDRLGVCGIESAGESLGGLANNVDLLRRLGGPVAWSCRRLRFSPSR